MYSRKDYLDGRCTHSEYYKQLVEKSANAYYLVLLTFGLAKLRKAYEQDEYFNTIPIKEWDELSKSLNVDFTTYGDSCSESGCVCVLKEAARMLVNGTANIDLANYNIPIFVRNVDDYRETWKILYCPKEEKYKVYERVITDCIMGTEEVEFSDGFDSLEDAIAYIKEKRPDVNRIRKC